MTPTTLTSHDTYEETAFKKLTFTGEVVEHAEFHDCTFSRCDFSETAFRRCRFIGCTFDDCAMKMTKFEGSTLARAAFNKCNLLGVDWTEADWSDWAAQSGSLSFTDCNLTYSVFLRLELKGMKLTGCEAREANFAEAILTEADLSGADFTGAVFLNTDLTGANLVGAKGYSISIYDNKTKRARFSLPEAVRLLYHMDIVMVDPSTHAELDEDQLDTYL
jgi:uncharacterized protein YjbI with pentapeptide repeats